MGNVQIDWRGPQRLKPVSYELEAARLEVVPFPKPNRRLFVR
ncbi:hypothetical protein SBA7_40019 [Candidatus Sulfotelmatobacter sp. SbA7]|nr:hypothetical protein SBA7_40019 [Candidatus Sulfotelmatobacter sp. SbA7]